MKKACFSIAIIWALGACSYSSSQQALEAAPPPSAQSKAEYDRLTFAQAACGGCHAVEIPDLSPNPASPTFAEIANRDGLTKATLVRWLTDAHNYPEVMDFDLDPAQVEDIADYILTLRGNEYVRPKD